MIAFILNRSPRDDDEVRAIVEFAHDAVGIGRERVAVRFVSRRNGRGGGWAFDSEQHGRRQWTQGVRYGTTLYAVHDGYADYGRRRVCGHSKQMRDWWRLGGANRAYTEVELLHERGETRVGRWPIYHVDTWQEHLVHLAAHELAHILAFARARQGSSEVWCEEVAARALEAWRRAQEEPVAAGPDGPEGTPSQGRVRISPDALTNATGNGMIASAGNPDDPQEDPMTKPTTNTKITGLSALNVAAIRDVMLPLYPTGTIDLTPTTATFWLPTREALLAVEHAIGTLAGRGHPKASLHAVKRRIAAQIEKQHAELEREIEVRDEVSDETLDQLRTAGVSEARVEAMRQTREIGTFTLTAKANGALKNGSWHVRRDDETGTVTTYCGLVLDEDTSNGISVHIVADVDERAVAHGNPQRPVCTKCIAIRAHKFDNSNATTEEVNMAAGAASASNEANPDPKIKNSAAAGQSRKPAARKPAARKPAARKAASTTTAPQENPVDLVKALTAEVRKAVTGVKVEPGPGGVRTYFRIKIGDKVATLGFARAGDRKAAVQVGSEARAPLTSADVPKVATKMAKRADQLRTAK